jgi:hypothetical protein
MNLKNSLRFDAGKLWISSEGWATLTAEPSIQVASGLLTGVRALLELGGAFIVYKDSTGDDVRRIDRLEELQELLDGTNLERAKKALEPITLR